MFSTTRRAHLLCCVVHSGSLQISNPNGDIMVTNDGATILRSIIVDNPAAKVLIDISKTQDEEVGDGTTSVTVLTGELLREAEKLIGLRIHPMTIIDGWRRATVAARAALEASSLDHSADEVAFREDLMNIARTTLSSKLLTHEKDQFGACPLPLPLPRSPASPLHAHTTAHCHVSASVPAAKLAVDAVLRIRNTLNLEQIQILKRPGGSLKVRPHRLPVLVCVCRSVCLHIMLS